MNAKEQLEILKRGVVEIIDENSLLRKLEFSVSNNKPLRIKLGVDPTSPDIHLGFTVVMKKLKQFQDLGHQVILIIGDYTATIGDPSGKSKTRKQLSHSEVLKNAEEYKKQFFQIVDPNKTEIVYNGDWFKTLSFNKISEIMSKITIAQMLERQDFKNRYTNGTPISLHEFLYPLMQGLDSVIVEADVEIGGTDQKFNVLVGRDLQSDKNICELFEREYKEPQIGLFMPILIGTDGKEKMSKSYGNYVGISESPQTMYHKIYNIPDELVENWTTLLTDLSLIEIEQLKSKNDVKHWKTELSKKIVSCYYGENVANECELKEISIHSNKLVPDDAKTVTINENVKTVLDLLVYSNVVKSRNEGKNLINNGGVFVENVKVNDFMQALPVENFILRTGKRNYLKIEHDK